ncbi:methyltransferase domain-containing protein [Paenibacillus kobensis]|uniref:methyltransferase domain-containing protein n=1 Tax=Paenibacillus kobensis TaxID=59841 RepID=UPI000FD87FF5|nr:methyltransferase domain-containing protein [Paenibacillus kobensis]
MLTSIVMVTYNKLAYTVQCIDSIRRHTEDGTYELIVVDNNSEDGTPEWLEQQPDVRLIRNDSNAGFPKATNQGLEQAAGDLLMLLNNDTVAAPGWLDNLKRALLSGDDIGAVGPVTNNASYSTSIPVPYASTDDMEPFAADYNRSDPAKWEERIKLIGFCLLMKREAYEKAGPLDEQFGIGNFEDDDLCFRMLLSGYKLLLCRDTFIHHYGSVSFGDDRSEFLKLLARNTDIFQQKWGLNPESAMSIRFDMLGVLTDQLEEGAPLRALEIGCACGATLLALKFRYPGSELFGAERTEAAARIARAAGIHIFASGRPDDWTIPDGTLDLILISNAHAYAEHTDQLNKLIRKLRPGGCIIAGFRNSRYYRYADQTGGSGGGEKKQAAYATDQAGERFLMAGIGRLRYALALEPNADRDEAALAAAAEREEGVPQEELASAYFLLSGKRAAIASDRAARQAQAPAPAPEYVQTAEQETQRRQALELEQAPEQERTAGRQAAEKAGPGQGPWQGPGRTAEPVETAECAASETAAPGLASEADSDQLEEQNDVAFTGERLVVNQEVKSLFRDVYNEHIVRYEAAAGRVSGLHVLDAACGAGYGARMLRDAGAASVIGVDIDAETVRLAQRDYGHPGIVFMQGDVLNLPFADETFDAVVSFETIEHVESGYDWIRESARVLKPGGWFIVSTPNRAVTNASNYWEDQPFNPHHRFEYRTGELIGDLLAHYSIEELHGQHWVDDSRFAAMRWLRQMNDQSADRSEANVIRETGSELLPFRQFRSGEPMYIVAVCRKRKGGAPE